MNDIRNACRLGREAIVTGSVLLGVLGSLAGCSPGPEPAVHVRVNLVGYLPGDAKVAIAFSEEEITGSFRVTDAVSGVVVREAPVVQASAPGWGRFDYYYELDFSDVSGSGRYVVDVGGGRGRSPEFAVGPDAYADYHESLLAFMRQQRCGYNPFIDRMCHQLDAKTLFGPMPDSTQIDTRGGWHDAGDQLKYLITSSNATARMLMAYEAYPGKFGDEYDDQGKPGGNGVPDVLDEAKWGLDWIHKLHPAPDQLFHQLADDRDHIGWKWPYEDSSDYGWGPNSYLVVYFATGKPQGAGEYLSEATGVANLAGRSAAAMAIAYRVFQRRGDEEYAVRALKAARELYAMGRRQEGYQQGNSYGAPYRYTERTWEDDMEWGAAELFRATGERRYRDQARHYARSIASTSWMEHDSTEHYEFYPFLNAAHYALSKADPEMTDQLAAYYRDGIERIAARAARNPFGVGVPFIWCSNNLTVALITQILLYEEMTGDTAYRKHMIAHRDWLLGRNPWGTSMFTGIPPDGEYPVDVHTSLWVLTKREAPGGLVDGPVFGTIYRQLIGLTLLEPDEFADVQNPFVVYHDDIGDYSTNEPTMDGTAGAVHMMAHFAAAR
jgi:hypothetical protein